MQTAEEGGDGARNKRTYLRTLHKKSQTWCTILKHVQIHFPYLFAELTYVHPPDQIHSCFTYAAYSNIISLGWWYTTVHLTTPSPLHGKVLSYFNYYGLCILTFVWCFSINHVARLNQWPLFFYLNSSNLIQNVAMICISSVRIPLYHFTYMEQHMAFITRIVFQTYHRHCCLS